MKATPGGASVNFTDNELDTETQFVRLVFDAYSESGLRFDLDQIMIVNIFRAEPSRNWI